MNVRDKLEGLLTNWEKDYIRVPSSTSPFVSNNFSLCCLRNGVPEKIVTLLLQNSQVGQKSSKEKS